MSFCLGQTKLNCLCPIYPRFRDKKETKKKFLESKNFLKENWRHSDNVPIPTLSVLYSTPFLQFIKSWNLLDIYYIFKIIWFLNFFMYLSFMVIKCNFVHVRSSTRVAREIFRSINFSMIITMVNGCRFFGTKVLVTF